MTTTMWELPVPSTALLDVGAVLEGRLRREMALRMAYEIEDEVREVALVLDGVEAYKVTHYNARSGAMRAAYDKLIDVGESDWLVEVRSNLVTRRASATGLVHLMINFDDGPCYEFICRVYRVEDKPR